MGGDCLPPDKRGALQEQWEQTKDVQDKYMMFLEYSSYLRKPEITEEDKVERKKRLEPLMKEFGLNYGGEEDEKEGWGGVLMWLMAFAVMLLIAAGVYYSYRNPKPLAH